MTRIHFQFDLHPTPELYHRNPNDWRGRGGIDVQMVKKNDIVRDAME